MSAQLALSDAAASERGRVRYIDFKERRWIPGFMFLVDVAAVESALFFGYLARSALFPSWPITIFTDTYVALAIGVIVIPISYVFVGLSPGYGLGVVERLRRRVTVTTCVFGVLIVWDNIVLHGEWSRGVMLSAFAVALGLTLLSDSLTRNFLIRRNLWGIPVVLAGAGKTGAMLARILRAEPQLGFVPIGFVDDFIQKKTEVEGLPLLGHVEEANSLADHVDTVILTMPGAGPQRLAQLVQGLQFPRIIVVPNLFELPSLWVKPRDFAGVLGLELQRNLLVRRNQVIKRISDYILGVPLFLISLPIVIGAVICIKIASPGPAFFKQQRDGLHGRKFHMWKLRTMYPNAEAQMENLLRENPAMHQQWQRDAKIEHDPRIIPVIGSWLRITSIDELPQLWNVLRGDMSLIGPRPFVDYHLALFSDHFRQFRSKVRPGITGFWQVLMRNDGDIRAQETMDIYYVRNWSLWLDLYILLRTIPAVVSGKGAR